MKIRVNYDLLEKIKETEKGFSLKRVTMSGLLWASVFSFYDFHSVDYKLSKELYTMLLFRLLLNMGLSFMREFSYSPRLKSQAIYELTLLASNLRQMHVSTDYELLLKAYEYQTIYSFVLDEDKIPRLKQNKYIMVPAVDRDGEKEVSLVQEHLIGSKDYVLSYGSPKKSLKLAYKPI